MKKLIFALVCVAPAFACRAAIYTVDPSGNGDATKIQEAIDKSWHGDVIFVKPGTYNENIRFNGRAILVTSKDPNNASVVASTIIRSDFGYSVNFDFGEGVDSVLTGFTVTGQGIYCYGASPTISKNVIRDCGGTGIRGGRDAAPVVLGNSISSNVEYGLYWLDGPIRGNVITGNGGGLMYCDGLISDNVISDNTVVGSGGGLNFCEGDVIGNVIENNRAGGSGGGLCACDGRIAHNRIIGNISGIDGGGINNCDGPIHNNVIGGNVAEVGGGMYGCDGPVRNNTLVGNVATGYSFYGHDGAAIAYCSGVVSSNIIAFNEAAETAGIHGSCTSSYNCFWMNAGGNVGGGATPGPGDVVMNPHFAEEGYWDTKGTGDPNDDVWVDGDYHLKSVAGRWNPVPKLWVKDTVVNSCVDAGDPAGDWTWELWPHGKRINVGAYGGTAEASMSLSDEGNVADLNNDRLVDYNDLILLGVKWAYNEVLLREDLNRDGFVNFVDYIVLLDNWQPKPPPPRPPIPNPMTWAVAPYATSASSIAMVATTATSTDESGVEYWFEDALNPAYNSGWLSFGAGEQAIWEDTGLAPFTEYSYKVKARNKDNLLETGWSAVRSATTPSADKTPPTPNPMQWEVTPHEIKIGGGTFDYYSTMEAKEATDASGVVEYYFECTSEGDFSSSWRTDPVYTVRVGRTGLRHRFRVKARDAFGNETGWSSELQTTP